jgi:excisionase family DNA binding protein
MATLPADFPEPITPSAQDSRLARDSVRQLSKVRPAARAGGVRLRIASAKGSEQAVTIPRSAFRLLTSILTEMAAGNAVRLIPTQAEMTTQQAADLLHVSRPFLVDQMEQGRIPFRKVGSHRRVLLADLLRYKREIDANRLQDLEELSALDQELGLGY